MSTACCRALSACRLISYRSEIGRIIFVCLASTLALRRIRTSKTWCPFASSHCVGFATVPRDFCIYNRYNARIWTEMSQLCSSFRLGFVALRERLFTAIVFTLWWPLLQRLSQGLVFILNFLPWTESLQQIQLSCAWAWECWSRSRVSRWGPQAVQQLCMSTHELDG